MSDLAFAPPDHLSRTPPQLIDCGLIFGLLIDRQRHRRSAPPFRTAYHISLAVKISRYLPCPIRLGDQDNYRLSNIRRSHIHCAGFVLSRNAILAGILSSISVRLPSGSRHQGLIRSSRSARATMQPPVAFARPALQYV